MYVKLRSFLCACFGAGALAFVSLSASAYQPWASSYNPATGVSSASVTSIPGGSGWAASQAAIDRASASSAYRVALTGAMSGPVESFSARGFARVAGSALSMAIGGWGGVFALAAGGALWGLYQELGATIGQSGEPVVLISQGASYWVCRGTQYSSLDSCIAGAFSAVCAAGGGYVCSGPAAGGLLLLQGPAMVVPGQTNPGSVAWRVKRYGPKWDDPSGTYSWDMSSYTWVQSGYSDNAVAVRVMTDKELSFDFEREYSGADPQPDMSNAVAETMPKRKEGVPVPEVGVELDTSKPLPAVQRTPKRVVDNPTAAQKAAAGVTEGPVYVNLAFKPRYATDPKTGTPVIVWDSVEEASPSPSAAGSPVLGSDTKGGSSSESEGVDLCKLYPTILACAKFGDVSSESPPAPTEDSVPSPSAVQFGSSSGCPQAITVTLPWGMTVLLEWVPLCDIASQFFAPLVLFLASYSAFMGFVRSFTV